MARGPSLSSFTPSIGRGSVRVTTPLPARMRGAPTSRQKQNAIVTVCSMQLSKLWYVDNIQSSQARHGGERPQKMVVIDILNGP